MVELKVGSRGDDVRTVQTMLLLAGYPVDIDGIFGPQTESAIKEFQATHNLPISGVVESVTLNALYNATTYGGIAPYTTDIPVNAPPTKTDLPLITVTPAPQASTPTVIVPDTPNNGGKETMANSLVSTSSFFSDYRFYLYAAGAALAGFLLLTLLPKEK